MSPKKIDICCFSCDCTTATSLNEWLRFDGSHITPVQKPWYTSTRIKDSRRTWRQRSELPEISSMSVSEAICTNCEQVLGQYCRAAAGPDGESVKENVFYDSTAIYLKEDRSKQEVDPIFRKQSQDRLQRKNSFPVLDPGKPRPMSSLLAEHDAHIKKLSQDVSSLQARMLALEKAMIERRTDLRASSMDGMSTAEDMRVANADTMLAVAKDVGSAGEAVEDLRSQNERLQQKLRSMESPTEDRIKDEFVEAAAGMATRTFPTEPAEPEKKKRPHPRRKVPARSQSTTPAAVGPGSSYARDRDQDDPPQIGSLAALNEIAAAMTRISSVGGLHNSNGSASCIYDQSSTYNMSPAKPGMNEENDVVTGQQRGRRRTSNEMMGDGEAATYSQKKKKATDRIAWMDDDAMIDPALRPASVPANQDLPAPDVLLPIQNPPGHRQARPSESQNKTDGVSQYDSVHEARIREHKDKDALRKRKKQEVLNEKRRKEGEVQFRQEEKVRARENMIKELMEWEEMLENDGDL